MGVLCWQQAGMQSEGTQWGGMQWAGMQRTNHPVGLSNALPWVADSQLQAESIMLISSQL